MKILVASDLHYRLKQFDWLVSQAHHYDAVIIAGDMLDISSTLDLNVQIHVITKYLEKIAESAHLMVCSGNHDGNEKNQAEEFIAPWLKKVKKQKINVDGDNIFFGDTLFTIFPWWDGEVTRQEVSEQFKIACKLEFKQWIWIYHAPPDNSPTSWSGKRFIGDSDLNQWIEQYQPKIIFTGHIHESPFKKEGSWVDQIGNTWVFNAGSYFGDIPAHLTLDLEADRVEWHSLAGDESRQLV